MINQNSGFGLGRPERIQKVGKRLKVSSWMISFWMMSFWMISFWMISFWMINFWKRSLHLPTYFIIVLLIIKCVNGRSAAGSRLLCDLLYLKLAVLLAPKVEPWPPLVRRIRASFLFFSLFVGSSSSSYFDWFALDQ